MTRWEYAKFSKSDGPLEKDSITFSHPQTTEFLAHAKNSLGRGLHGQDSKPTYLHLNLRNATAVQVLGMLGEDDWELVSHSTHSTMTEHFEDYILKRPLD